MAHTPIREALRTDSPLHSSVRAGLGALKTMHRGCFDIAARAAIADSIDIDESLKKGREQENRWDYLLGHHLTKILIAVEPHSADNSQIRTVINKRKAAIQQLGTHLRDGKKVSKWIWVASGRVRLLPIEKAKFLLDQNGIEFIGGEIKIKHLR